MFLVLLHTMEIASITKMLWTYLKPILYISYQFGIKNTVFIG